MYFQVSCMAQSPGLVSKHCQKLLFLNVLKNEINQLFIPNNYCSTYFNHIFYKKIFWGGYIKAFQKMHFFPLQGGKILIKPTFQSGFSRVLWVLSLQNGHSVKLWSIFHHYFPQSMSLGQKQGPRGLKYDKSENLHFLGVGGQKQA